ncbi:hypothetical protein Bbelb_147540 [Branchiostoma belcheri]|nr:hypothetical protein Bbelb_147540 [Branchiostoma belcheri]
MFVLKIKFQSFKVDIQVWEVEGYPPVYNDTCETPVQIGGKSGSLLFDVTSTAEIMEKHGGIISITSQTPDAVRIPGLYHSVFYHAGSDCRVQFAASARHKLDIAAARDLRGSGFKCLQCFSSSDDAAVFELAVLNADGSADCDFASDVGSNFDYITKRFDIAGSLRIFEPQEDSEKYHLNCKMPNLTLSLPMRNHDQQYEVTRFIRLGFDVARDGVYSTISHADSVKTDAEDLLPLKWMALESLKCRHFTCESDTWSFGVLLWEIAAFGEEPNYQEMVRLTYPNLVEFLRRGMRLLKPRGCPNRLYDVMRSCWRQEPSARPTPEELEQKLTECRHEIDLQFVERETTV